MGLVTTTLATFVVLAMPQNAPDVSDARRVVAIGDVHGDFESFRLLLMGADLIDETLAWTGGETVLVQTGDLLDRGPDSRKVLDLLMRLETEAKAAGGRAMFLLGNHEIFNLTGDLRYVHDLELSQYVEKESATERQAHIAAVAQFLSKPSELLHSGCYAQLLDELRKFGYDEVFPPGYFRHRVLFSPRGKYGKWLLAHEAIAKVDSSLFLHGGLSPRFGKVPFRTLRTRFRKDLSEYFAIVDEFVELGVFHPMLGYFDLRQLIEHEEETGRVHPRVAPLIRRYRALDSGPVFHEEGLVWYRGLAAAPERQLRRAVGEILRAQDAERIVIGHTQHDALRIVGRFNGRVVLIDTGLNHEAYGGSAEALEILSEAGPAEPTLQVIELHRRVN